MHVLFRSLPGKELWISFCIFFQILATLLMFLRSKQKHNLKKLSAENQILYVFKRNKFSTDSNLDEVTIKKFHQFYPNLSQCN